MRFGEKLCAMRKEKGLTQAELAKLAGVGLRTITNYEKGTTYPQNREVYSVLAQILGCDAEEDMDELMLAIQEAYIDAKKRNKKYTPKKYRKQNEEN